MTKGLSLEEAQVSKLEEAIEGITLLPCVETLDTEVGPVKILATASNSDLDYKMDNYFSNAASKKSKCTTSYQSYNSRREKAIS
jgi:hypothetical protein